MSVTQQACVLPESPTAPKLKVIGGTQNNLGEE